jgi:hypothetical protein
MEDEDRIQLNCPICQKIHEYRLEVDRSCVLYNILSTSNQSKTSVKRFRRIFMCPEKGEPFEATIKIEESFGEKINDVKVV